MPELKVVSSKQSSSKYQPVLSATERKAYQAAHRIMSSDLDKSVAFYGCPSTRRVKLVDAIAAIIMEETR